MLRVQGLACCIMYTVLFSAEGWRSRFRGLGYGPWRLLHLD